MTPETTGEPPGKGQRQHRACGHRKECNAELEIPQREPLLDLGNVRQPTRHDETVSEENERNRYSGAQQDRRRPSIDFFRARAKRPGWGKPPHCPSHCWVSAVLPAKDGRRGRAVSEQPDRLGHAARSPRSTNPLRSYPAEPDARLQASGNGETRSPRPPARASS